MDPSTPNTTTPTTKTPTTLPSRPLGSTGLDISAVGFGAWAAGGGGWAFGWGPQDDEQSISAMRHAAECGINWIDTAAIYGLGHSEELVGKLILSLPANDRPYVFTKCGLIWDDRDRMAPARRTLQPASIRKECEASLGRLGIERIDLFQFHWPGEDAVPIEDSWEEMGRLIDEGKIRFGGVSNFNVPLVERCEARRHVSSEQSPFSLIRRDAATDLIPWCEAHHTGFLCYSPMQAGILTDTFTAERMSKLAPDDWRNRAEPFQQPQLQRNLALRDSLRPIAARHETSVASVAVAWVLSWQGVSGAIVGARSPEQVDGWIAAASLKLTTEDLDEIGAAIEKTGAGSGPNRP
jgi:aryl-alcohol dehydrogenase-like predicted oxidoreductase